MVRSEVELCVGAFRMSVIWIKERMQSKPAKDGGMKLRSVKGLLSFPLVKIAPFVAEV